MGYIVTWLLVLIVSIALFYRASGSLSLLKPNMISITFYYSLFVSSFIGALLIALNIDQYYMIGKLKNEEFRIIGFYIICFVMVMFPLIMVLLSNLVGFHASREFDRYLKSPIVEIFKGKNEFYILFLGLSCLSILAVAYTLLKVGQVPLFELFKGSTDLARLRIEASRGFEGNVLFRNIFAIGFTPILSLVAYVYAVKTGQFRWKTLFIVLFISSVLINTYSLAKSPIIFYLMMLLFVRIYIGKTVFNVKRLVLFGSAATILIIVMYIYVQGDQVQQFFSYSSGPIGRLILAQISPFFLHLDLFGQIIPYLEGRSFPSIILNLYDLDQVRSARLAMEYYFPNRIEDGTGGVLNTLFIAEAYANYGYAGIVIGTIYVALVVQTMYIVFLRLPKHPVFISLFVYFTINIPRTIVGGFVDFIFNPIWLIIVFFLVGMLLFIRFRIDFTKYLKAKEELR